MPCIIMTVSKGESKELKSGFHALHNYCLFCPGEQENES